ncbi:glycosyltransferase family 9 protein [Pseudogulbenkiania ferrooxidans]|uniref:glycosyltransferase family 9 protein n=1 Tax=Pseudogulbenkiania ferrooxidans TaxID=549169 RepID=UPI001F317E90|nr:glycosyltransferase family 9 protein [Pseudogulbenkiania ferrooxidans]
MVIRRDNIGDLICTTPLLQLLRDGYPDARIDLLVNDYNAPVVMEGQPVDAVHIYRKAKHRDVGESKLAIWWQTFKLILSLRQQRYDFAILAGSTYSAQAAKFARLIGAKSVVGYLPGQGAPEVDLPVSPLPSACHHVEATAHLASALSIGKRPGAVRIVVPERAARRAGDRLATMSAMGRAQLRVGIHISARKPSQRWSLECFEGLIRRLHTELDAEFLLFWAPGTADNPSHPGDDEKAASLLARVTDLPVQPFASSTLDDLMAGLDLCDSVVCSDGGAMHVANALGKPIVCFFGGSDATHWRPWNEPYQLLQPASQNVTDITVEQAVDAFLRLLRSSSALHALSSQSHR